MRRGTLKLFVQALWPGTISSSAVIIEANHIDLMFLGSLQDVLWRDHHAQIDDLIVVTLEDNAHDVLPDVMNITLDRRHQDLAGFVLHQPNAPLPYTARPRDRFS